MPFYTTRYFAYQCEDNKRKASQRIQKYRGLQPGTPDVPIFFKDSHPRTTQAATDQYCWTPTVGAFITVPASNNW